jgi:hypothetical protein
MNVRRAILAFAALATAAVAGACTGSSSKPNGAAQACPPITLAGSTTVPSVVEQSFPSALATLLGAHLRVAVPRFIPFHDAMAEQGWGKLANYKVVSQSPAAGETRRAGGTVVLRLSDPLFRGPRGSMIEPLHHPRYARIPDLVGRTYRQAMAAGNEKSGILVRVSSTAPLQPAASTCGLAAFQVISQTPRPGTRVLWNGIEPDSVDPGLATVTIRLRSSP